MTSNQQTPLLSGYSTAPFSTLWQQREEGYIRGVDQKQLYWVSVTSTSHSKAILLINGRVESAWKYQELICELFAQGYDIFSFDHRGQGLSDRLTDDPQIGHVENFSDYVDDMAQLVAHFQLDSYQQRFILAHSMGGAIASRYLQGSDKHDFDAIALSAPMFGINMPAYLRPLSPYITHFASLISSKPSYISQQKGYRIKPFERNLLTSSSERYHWFKGLYEAMPELKIGGPSARWVWQGITAANACIEESNKLTLPLLLLQGGEDKIVSNRDHHLFINKLQQTNSRATLATIQGSRHEILFEADQYRQPALDQILQFFSAIPQQQV